MEAVKWCGWILGACSLAASVNAAHVPQGVFSEESMQAALASPEPAIRAIAQVSQPGGSLSALQVRDWHSRWLQTRPDGATRAMLARHACNRSDAWRRLCVDADLWQDWVAHEPGNAQPWLLQAWLAQQQDDEEALQRALEKVADCDYIDLGSRQDLALSRRWAESMLGPHTPSGELAMHALGSWLAFVQPMQTYTALCPTGRGEPVRMERRELCQQVAEWMIDSPDGSILLSLVGYPIAIAYAETNDERRELLAARHLQEELFHASIADERMRFDPDNGIPDYVDDYVQLVIKHGERQAIIDWLALKPEAAAQ